jgi:dTDP-4-dehydrorhamnose reductase
MNILITGARGQLAQEFQVYFSRKGIHNVTALEKEKLDISRLELILDAFSYFKPQIVINCAAYNFVDKAERESEYAFKVNAIGVKNLAVACKKNNSFLVHYSTDYVFDGEKEDFYTEEDIPNPINVYGKSKLEGERFIFQTIEDFLIFRVSWVYGIGKQNFLYKIKEWSVKNNILRIVCDQVSVPTYTEDIVKYTVLCIENGLRGLYHLTNGGYCSRFELSRYFLESIGWKGLILPVDSDFFRSDAKRPYFSAMSNKRLSNALTVEIPDWRDAVNRFIKDKLEN